MQKKLNTRSSTEAKLVGINDVMSMILWTRLFLEAQGYHVADNVLHQDSESTIKLARNGRHSSSKQTRHIEVRYYFITDHINWDRLRVSYCPTRDMLADYFSKPLQGSLFRKFRNLILNVSSKDKLNAGHGEQECVGTTNSENANTITSLNVEQVVATVGGIPQDPTSNQGSTQGPTSNQGSTSNQAEPYYSQAKRSYADVVQDNQSTHSIELIK